MTDLEPDDLPTALSAFLEHRADQLNAQPAPVPERERRRRIHAANAESFAEALADAVAETPPAADVFDPPPAA